MLLLRREHKKEQELRRATGIQDTIALEDEITFHHSMPHPEAVFHECFSLHSYPKCNYEQLRDFLVLPCKRKLQDITSSIDKDQVLRETFDKVRTLQLKNVFLLVDEVQIRPTVQFSGGLLSGMAENNRDCRATSMLCVMMKSLHKGPSLMISVELTLTVPRCSIVWQMFY
ncbi:hypothetical protein FHG87_019016 [Trinorchestia longiramus]|nr:hypothetical protein FHG87_019016 [Trinorchestia longiramus]